MNEDRHQLLLELAQQAYKQALKRQQRLCDEHQAATEAVLRTHLALERLEKMQ